MISLDMKAFFDSLRGTRLFPKGFTKQQVDGLNYICGVWQKTYQERMPLTQFAACLGQCFLETASTMQPVHEYGNREYFMRMYDKTGARPSKAAELGNTEVGDGAKFAGMGYIQLTGRAHARRTTRRMRQLGLIGPDVDFEQNPELLMKPEISAHIMFLGMEEGWFTGRKLDDLVDVNIDGDEHADFMKARAIINGTDKAAIVADNGDTFLSALKLARRTAHTPTPSQVPPVQPPPDPVGGSPAAPSPATPAAPAPSAAPTPAQPDPPGWFEHLLSVLRSGRK